MHKAVLAALSFALGALSVVLVENHTATFAQETKVPGPGVIRIPGLVPVVPPLANARIEGDMFDKGSIYPVDGFICKNCIFHGATLEYGGGEYFFDNAKIDLPIGIKLVGAAQNTAIFLNSFGLLGCPAKTPPPPNPAPLLQANYAPSGTMRVQRNK